MDLRIAGKWHKRVQNAILWKKMQKWKIMLDFRLFCWKRHEIFANPVFKTPAICIVGSIVSLVFYSLVFQLYTRKVL